MDKYEMTRLMKETLEDGLSRLRGHAIKILEIQREPFSGSSSFSTERLRVLVNGDEWLEVFFKDLNPMHQLDDARIIRKPELDRSRREQWLAQGATTLGQRLNTRVQEIINEHRPRPLRPELKQQLQSIVTQAAN